VEKRLSASSPSSKRVAMAAIPSVVAAEYRGGYRIHLRFSDNTAKVVDFRKWLDGPIFEPLKDTAYFQRFFLEAGTVGWPNGADIAPETLHQDKGVRGGPNKRMQLTRSAPARRRGLRS
jgi:hypothetical protein